MLTAPRLAPVLTALALGALAPAATAQPLSPAGERNLVALTHLTGMVRYFHPTDAAAGVDWDALIVDAVPRVEHADSADDLREALIAVVGPYAPSVVIGDRASVDAHTGAPHPVPATVWQHRGFGLATFNGGIAESVRTECDAADCAEHAPAVAKLAPDLWCVVPLAIATGDQTGAPPSEHDTTGDAPSDRRAERLAAVIVAWSALQHFHVYFDQVYADWDDVLRRSLRDAATADTPLEFRAVLNRMLAPLQDGHGSVTVRGITPGFGLPFRWEWIEGRPVITATSTDALALGDVVESFDGDPAPDLIRRAELESHGATPHYRRHRAMIDLTYRQSDAPVTLRVRRTDGTAADIEVAPNETRYWAWAPTTSGPARPTSLSELAPGVVYVDLNSMTDEELTDALPRLAETEAIVFDIRFYPRAMYYPRWLEHLIDEPVPGLEISLPHVPRPNRQGMRHEHVTWEIEPSSPRLTDNVVVLSGVSGLSSCESHVGMALAAGLEVVGETTGGTNGNVFNLALPGGCGISFTGAHVRNAGGTRHFGVGCVPTERVERTIAGIAAGRDEALERAVAILTEAE